MIKVSIRYIETLVNSPLFPNIKKKQLDALVSGHLTRALFYAQHEIKPYLISKNELLKKWAEVDENGKLKDNGDGRVSFKTREDEINFFNELAPLQNDMISINMEPIKLDLKTAPTFSVDEMMLILPLLEGEELNEDNM